MIDLFQGHKCDVGNDLTPQDSSGAVEGFLARARVPKHASTSPFTTNEPFQDKIEDTIAGFHVLSYLIEPPF